MKVRPTRTTQPMRKGRGRKQGPALAAARRGKPRYLRNPQDVKRRLVKRRKAMLKRNRART